MNYNLCDENWIPVLYRNGQFKEVGIVQALQEAGQISQIAASNPMDRVALLRFLLAIVYWCQGNPPAEDEKERILADGQFPKNWFGKLEQKKELFNLLGDGQRFLQDISAQRKRPITDLIHEVPAGNNFWHFNHAIDYHHGLCPACCARGLLRLPLFHVSGLPDLKSGINGVPPIYVMPLGKTLLETLRLNWRQHGGDLGVPAWEDCRMTPPTDAPVPLLTGLTVLSRRVYLHDPSESDECCIGCGKRVGELILSCEFQSAGSLENRHWKDPHVVYSSSDKAVKAPNLEDELIADSPWCQLFSAVSFPDESRGLTLFITGFSTSKAKYVDVWERTCKIGATNPDSVRQWKETVDNLRRLKPKDWDAMEPKGRKYTGIRAGVTAMTPHVETQVSRRIPELTANDGETDFQEGLQEYRKAIGILASSLYPNATSEHLDRQRQLQEAVRLARPRKSLAKKERKER